MSVGRRRTLAALTGFAALGTLGTTGCGWLPRQAVVPMPLIRQAGPCTGQAPALVVMLPGAYSRPEEFVAEGYLGALRESRAAADAVVADAHLGYFRNRSVFDRLQADVIGPARAQGYRVWLVGISLGGFGALGHAMRHPADIEGVVALAPYVGERALLREIAEAGGPAAWHARPPPEPAEGDDPGRALWRYWAAPPAGAPPLYLGFGREDRLVEGHRLLARTLAPDRVTEVPGGHDWPPWRALWQQWLARGLLPEGCGVVASARSGATSPFMGRAPSGQGL